MALKYICKFKIIDTKEIQVIIVDRVFDNMLDSGMSLLSKPNIIVFYK